MKERSSFSKVIVGAAVLMSILAIASVQAVEMGKAVVRHVKGSAEYSEGGGSWAALKAGMTLKAGAVVKTGNDSSVDLFLDQNGPLVRLAENTTLGLDKLCFEPTGADTVVETQLDLKAGKIVGIVKKLAPTSKYEVKTPNGVAGIRGTEYVISATGEVEVVTGSVVVVYVKADGSVVTQEVRAGQKFDPATGKVSDMTPDDQRWALEQLGSMKGVSAPGFEVPTQPVIYVSPVLGAGTAD
jgi:hypothetical protein